MAHRHRFACSCAQFRLACSVARIDVGLYPEFGVQSTENGFVYLVSGNQCLGGNRTTDHELPR